MLANARHQNMLKPNAEKMFTRESKACRDLNSRRVEDFLRMVKLNQGAGLK